jgi:hypothetical protein
MRSTKPSSIALSAIAVSLLGGAALLMPAQAQATGISVFSYAAKAVCEEEETSIVETDVNIHNPRYTTEYFFWKFVEADSIDNPNPVPATPPTPHKANIYGDGVRSIDCDTLGEGEHEGFIVVYSLKPLDVVGVLEVEDTNEEVEDMDINPVTPIKVVIPLALWTSWNTAAN